MSIIENFEQLNSLEEKLDFVKQLNKKSEFEQALYFYQILKKQFELQGNHDKVMDCLCGICQNLGNLGLVKEIEPYLSTYKVYCEKYGDDLAKLKLNSLIGYISNSIEDYETTVDYYEAALAIALKLEDIPRTIYLLINLQSVYLDLQQIDQALKCSDQLKQISKEDRNAFSTLSYCAYLLNYMTILVEQNEIEEIPSLMAELEQVEGYEKLKREQMYGAYIKGRYYELKNIPSKAINRFEIAYTYLEVTKESPYYKRILKNLIQNYKKLCQYEQVSFYSDLLISYLEDIERKALQTKTIELSRKLKLNEMHSLIHLDTLTNIYNRRYLEIKGEEWIKEAVAEKSDIACAIIDIDNFKCINDQYGHTVGDQVIKYFAEQLNKAMDDHMLCARLGGDEFVVLARYKEDNDKLFLQLFQTLRHVSPLNDKTNVQVEISMGVSSLSSCKQPNLVELIDIADKALYKTKSNGKDNITLCL